PIPTTADQTDAEKILRQLYKKEFDQAAQSAAVAQMLAQMLISEAKVTNDSPPLKYVALREAAVLALLARDTPLAKTACDGITQAVGMEEIVVHADVLRRAGLAANTQAQHVFVARMSLLKLDDASVGDDLRTVESLSETAKRSVALAKTPALVTLVQRRLEQ